MTLSTETQTHENNNMPQAGGVKFEQETQSPSGHGWSSCPFNSGCTSNTVEPEPEPVVVEPDRPSGHLSALVEEVLTVDNQYLTTNGLSRDVSAVSLNEESFASVTKVDYVTIVRPHDLRDDAPLVLLNGWAGCRDRYLGKYSNYYAQKGYMVARYTAPIHKIRSFSSYRQFALKLYENVLQLDQQRPIIIHSFSMNGCSVLAMLWDLLDNLSDGPDIKVRVKGLIFDSCPANVMPWHVANAVAFATWPRAGNWHLQRDSFRLFLTGVLSVHRAAIWLRSNFDQRIYESSYAYYMLTSLTDLPKSQLFLYSDKDDICIPSSIRDFQSIQKSRGVEVEEICWTDSDHCQHFRKYEADYTQRCLDFVTRLTSKP